MGLKDSVQCRKHPQGKLVVLTIVMKTKTSTVSASYRALLMSRNVEKNLINNSKNNILCNHLRGFFCKICFVFLGTFV